MSKVLLCVLFWQLLAADCLFSGDNCLVDNDLPGNCKLLQECAPLITEIQNAGTPMPARLRRKLQSLSCGFQSDEPLVCCQTPFTNADPQNWLPNNGDNGGNTWLTSKPITSTENTWQTNQPPTENLDQWGLPPTTEPLNEWINKNDNQNPPIDSDRNPETSSSSSDDRSEIPTYISVVSHRNLRLLPENCGDLDSDRIYGGRTTRLFEMPWMVLIAYESPQGRRLSCGGTLITERYVLTAAHCVSFLGNQMTLSEVVLGDHDVRRDPDCETVEGDMQCAPSSRNVSIERVVAHPGYSPQTLVHDIGLIRLSEPADFSLANMMPICLPTTTDLQIQPLVGKKGVVAGWGATESGLQSPVLLSVALPIIRNADCQAAYRGNPKINETHLCAGGELDKDSCGGDSGGPLMFPGRTRNRGTRYVQRGIVSFGTRRCGVGGYPGVYTNVAKHIDWILDNISS